MKFGFGPEQHYSVIAVEQSNAYGGNHYAVIAQAPGSSEYMVHSRYYDEQRAESKARELNGKARSMRRAQKRSFTHAYC